MEPSLSLAQLGLSLAAGSLTTLSPCVFPLLPLVVGGAVQANPWSPVAMGAGMAVSFALVGLALGALGPALGIDGDSVRIGGAWLLIAFAVVMLVPRFSARFTAWMTPIASSANALSARLDNGSLAGALGVCGALNCAGERGRTSAGTTNYPGARRPGGSRCSTRPVLIRCRWSPRTGC